MRRWLFVAAVAAGVVLVYLGGRQLWNHQERAAASEAFHPAELVVNGRAIPAKAGFWGLSGQGIDVSVEALVTALDGTVEKFGPKAPRDPDYVLLTLNGKRMVLYWGDRPSVTGDDIIWVQELTYGTLSSLGWDWSRQDVEKCLNLVYSKVTINTTFDWKHGELNKVVITTEP